MFRGLEMLLDTRYSAVEAYSQRSSAASTLVTGRLVLWCIVVVRAVAYQRSNSRQGVPCRSVGHALPPRPPLHYGQRYSPTFNGSSYHTFPLFSSLLKTIPVRVSYCCCAAVLTNKLYVHSSPVGVSVDVLVKERRGLQPAAVPPRHQSRALLATVRAKKNGKKRKIERKSQLCDLEARKTRRPPWPSMSPQQ